MTDTQSRAQIALQAWLSPAYPVGAYAYSHGLETAIEKGAVSNAGNLEGWLDDILHHGSGWNDALLIAEAFRLADASKKEADAGALADLARLASAITGTAELQQESLQQGQAFLEVTRKAWPHPLLDTLTAAIGANTAYPVCFGIAAAVHGCDESQAINGYLFAMVANWVSAAVRMNVIGQTAGQQIAAGIAAKIEAVTASVQQATMDDLGGCSFLSDIASFHHESQNARLFRS
ncbi:MAG: urease accessory protein UreF [Hyphomicrobiales bacterium]|nr:urease accessory protein UreF [Hyphomicrobiales bacterium]